MIECFLHKWKMPSLYNQDGSAASSLILTTGASLYPQKLDVSATVVRYCFVLFFPQRHRLHGDRQQVQDAYNQLLQLVRNYNVGYVPPRYQPPEPSTVCSITPEPEVFCFCFNWFNLLVAHYATFTKSN